MKSLRTDMFNPEGGKNATERTDMFNPEGGKMPQKAKE